MQPGAQTERGLSTARHRQSRVMPREKSRWLHLEKGPKLFHILASVTGPSASAEPRVAAGCWQYSQWQGRRNHNRSNIRHDEMLNRSRG